MYNDWFYLEKDRHIRERALAEGMAERRRYAQLKAGQPSLQASLRARLARRLFDLAVAAERQETWKAVWERLEAKGRL
mgnify:FL=1